MSGVETIYPGASLATGGGGGSGDVVGPASSLDGELVLFDGMTGTLLKGGGVPSVYLGPMTWAELQASEYANGSVGLAALDADASVFITDWGAVMVPDAGKTYWTSSTPIILSRFGSTALGNDIVYTATGTTVTAVASASAGAKTRCTSTAHGLTSANDGVSVAVTAGTNWTPGLYPMTYVDANNYDLTVAWNAGFGNPTVTAVTGSILQTTLKTVNIPAGLMQNNSVIDVSSIWQLTSSSNNHYITILLGGSPVLQLTPSSVTGFVDRRQIYNRGLKTAQIGSGAAVPGYGGAAPKMVSIDTSAATTLVFAGDMRTVNEFIRIAGYTVQVIV